MVELDIKFSDAYDWELHPNFSQLTTEKKIVKGRRAAKIVTVSEDMSVSKTSDGQSSAKNKDQTEEMDDLPPFAAAEFDKNELGF